MLTNSNMAPIIIAHHEIAYSAMINSISLLFVVVLAPALISLKIIDINRFKELLHIEQQPLNLIIPVCKNPEDSQSVKKVHMMKWFNKYVMCESDSRVFKIR